MVDSLDITGEQFGETPEYEMFNEDYAANVMCSWRECCQRTVGSESYVLIPQMPTHQIHLENVSTPKEAPTQFAYDEDRCPLLPNINMDKSTVEGLRKLLTDYVEVQWGMLMLFFLFPILTDTFLAKNGPKRCHTSRSTFFLPKFLGQTRTYRFSFAISSIILRIHRL